MPRRKKSKNGNKRRRSSGSTNGSPEKQAAKRTRIDSEEDLEQENDSRGDRVEQYEEEGMDVDSHDEHKATVATTHQPSSKPNKKYKNMDIAEMEEEDLRPFRIYLDGVFDMTHFGHFRLFRQVKSKFPNATIVVGVAGDEETKRLKGQTVFTEEERCETIGHCKWVDEVICPCPWIVTQEFLDENDIDYVAHDAAPYGSAGEDDIYKFVKDQGRFIATQRTEGVSTTGLINRIVSRYNEYILRNLQRGVPREDLNISWTRMQRIKAGHTLRENAQYLQENFKKFAEDPEEFVSGFLNMFGPGGRIRNKISEKIVEMREEFVEYAQFAPM